jgi:hypothetical protein
MEIVDEMFRAEDTTIVLAAGAAADSAIDLPLMRRIVIASDVE